MIIQIQNPNSNGKDNQVDFWSAQLVTPIISWNNIVSALFCETLEYHAFNGIDEM